MNRRVGSVWHSPLLKWGMAAILGCAVASALAAPNPVSGPKGGDGGFQTAAPHAVLIEAESGSVLFEKGADDLIPPASLSKLMTAEVVLNEVKQGRLELNKEFITSTNAWRRGGAHSRTSALSITIHRMLSVNI